jgi:predicted nucleotidyltransferase
MIYTIEQIKELIVPIAEKYKLKALWVFGSYARGEATDESDIDILIDYTDANIKGLFQLNGLFSLFEDTLNKNIDLVSTEGLYNPNFLVSGTNFVDEVTKQRILLYEHT